MPDALIVTVGGTPEPVAAALAHHKPAYACFLASQQTVHLLGKVTEGQRADLVHEIEIVEDAEDITGCYEKALRCFERAQAKGYGPERRVIDITGGTKAMTAALAIALVVRGGSFSYVGGTQRDKGGVGLVLTGCEQLRRAVNPFERFAVDSKRRIAQYFNSCQFGAAAIAAQALPEELAEREKILLEAVGVAADGYARWDRFQHREAIDPLKKAEAALGHAARLLSEPSFEWVRRFHAGVRATLADLQAIQERTRNFSSQHPLLAVDLVANAQRRIAEDKHDDAVARLYRALELLAQCEFERAFGCSTGKVSPAALPDQIRDEYVRKYGGESEGLLSFGFYPACRALAAKQVAFGKEFVENFRAPDSPLNKLVSARNQSVLAHGHTPVGRETAARFHEVVRQYLPKGACLTEFPKLDFE